MAEYVAVDTTYPTVGEVVMFFALRSGLVAATPADGVYDRLKVFVREQKGKDFCELETILDVLQRRLEEYLAPPGVGDITFGAFRRFLGNYKRLVLQGTASVIGRAHLLEKILIPDFFVPGAATILRLLNAPPFDFIDVDALLRADAPLRLVFAPALEANAISWMGLAELYEGKHASYSGRATVHDIEDNKKLVRKWGNGKATPDLATCLNLLNALDWGRYSGVVFWVWIGRFLQKIDKRYRVMIADAIRAGTKIPRPAALAERITAENDAIARMRVDAGTVRLLRMATTMLFYNTHRHSGDKQRVELLLEEIRPRVRDAKHVDYYMTWLEARYTLYCRDFAGALALYEKAFEQGMYGDPQAEGMILPEWAALAQKLHAKAALKRINSRMKMLGIYPSLDDDAVVAIRLTTFATYLGGGRQFIEAFR